MASYDSWEVPDAIEPLLGYRGWLTRDNALLSVYPDIREVIWPTQPLKATCLPPPNSTRRDERPDRRLFDVPPHDFPVKSCTCGIYALHEYPQVWEQYEGAPRKAMKPWGSAPITGVVKGWGHIVTGDKGFRAEFAYPVALVERPRSRAWQEIIKRLAGKYDLEIVTAEELRNEHWRAPS